MSTSPAPSSQSTNQTGVHPSAIGSGTKPATSTQPNQTRADSDASTNTQQNGDATGSNGSEYPEQKHAGKVGYGPLYNQGAGFTNKVGGIKEEIKGKITKNHDLIQHGKDRRTGELKHKELNEDNNNPFTKQDDDDDKSAPPGDNQKSPDASTGQTDREEKEEAATVAPQGTQDAESQKKGEAVEDVKNIG